MQTAFRGLVKPSNACQLLLRTSPSVCRRQPCFTLGRHRCSRWCCVSATCNNNAITNPICSAVAFRLKPFSTLANKLATPCQAGKQRLTSNARNRQLQEKRRYTTQAVQLGSAASTEINHDDAEQVDSGLDTEDGSDDLDDIDEEEIQQMLEDDDQPDVASGTITTEWGSKGMMVAEQVLQKPAMQELALFSFIVSPTGKQLKIRLDKPSDEYGSPSLDELSEFSKLFADEYSLALGSAADDVSVEVSSPGAERQVRLPQDLLRFQHLPMSVTFQLDKSDKVDTKVLDLVSCDEQAGMTEWKLSDVKQNRTGKGSAKLSKKLSEQRFKKPLASLQKVNLHLEV